MLRIARMRAELAAELHFNPSSSRPVLTYSWDHHARTMLPDEVEMSKIGATLSARMVRLASRGYGTDMAVRRALDRLESWCARRHVKPREPLHDERGYICPRLATFLVAFCNGAGEHGMEEAWLPEHRNHWYRRLIRHVAVDEELEYEEAAEFLSGALLQMESWMAEWQAGAA